MKLRSQLVFRNGANATIEKLQDNIKNKAATSYGPMNNTGEAANSLRYRFEENGTRLIVYSDMPGRSFNYLMTLEHGRGPGGFPPLDAIKQWIEQRGIQPMDISQDSLAFLIGRKIANQGTLVFRQGGNTGIISEVQTEDWIQENFIKPLELEFKMNIEKEFKEI